MKLILQDQLYVPLRRVVWGMTLLVTLDFLLSLHTGNPVTIKNIAIDFWDACFGVLVVCSVMEFGKAVKAWIP